MHGGSARVKEATLLYGTGLSTLYWLELTQFLQRLSRSNSSQRYSDLVSLACFAA